ncbi:sulfotransferase 1C3-like [Rhipicephalus microplus]|uniref:sulfotransferase 1C3-like n=1 Tax=Rhipicephalus microplus TaxID=6941 RepID=UPI003F6B7F22
MADIKAESSSPTSDKARYLHHFEGILVGDMFEESRLRSAFRYEPREEDVFVVGFPKTGTTWLHFVLQRIVNHASETPAQSAATCLPNVAFLEFAGGEKVEKLSRIPGLPLVIKTHLPFEKVRFSDKSRYVYVLRNPYDTCVSYYHQVQQKAQGCGDLTFDEFFEQFIDGWIHPNDYFDHLASWFAHKARPNFLCIAYEHMKKDPRSGIQKIAAFLGKEISDDAVLNEIVQTVSPDIMKRAFAEALSARQQEKSVKGRPPNGASDDSSDGARKLKGGSLVRTATVGDWKNHFSASQIERMKAKMASKTVGFRTDLEVLWKDANLP